VPHFPQRPSFGPSIADRYDPARNGITALRFALAASVVLFHAWPLGGFGVDPVVAWTGGQSPQGGTLAVFAFFGLSGFLLTQSRQRSGVRRFVLRRARRILPGYWACVAVVALVLGPAHIAAAWNPLTGATAGWAGFHGNPFANTVNAPVWSLGPEIVCYVLLGVVPSRLIRPFVTAFLAVTLLVYLAFPLISFAPPVSFAVGAAFALMRWRIPLHGALASMGVVVLIALAHVGGFGVAAVLLVPYVALWAAIRLPLRWDTDLSYGVYIYGWPIAQGLWLLGAADHGLPFYAAATFALTLPLAALSWLLVERPALSMSKARVWTAPSRVAGAIAREARHTVASLQPLLLAVHPVRVHPERWWSQSSRRCPGS
jgi:peptidoglycan/LPS O-acetylase OafA/YrhL